jgi:hypothetical protein
MKATGFKVSRIFRLVAWLVIGLPILYVLIYLLLSACGRYRPMSEADLTSWELFATWAPLGFYDAHPPAGSIDAKQRGGAWKWSVIRIYYRLWEADIHYVHKRQDVYMTSFLGEDGKWTYTTNNASPIANSQ